MARCWEFLGCKLTNCKMHGVSEGKQCWEVDGTENCSDFLFTALNKCPNKLEACKLCIYYKQEHPDDK